MKRIALLIVLAIPLASIAQTWATKEDQIKACMMMVYSNQSAFHLKHHNFTKKLEDLDLSNSKECKDIKINLTKASQKVFEAEVAAQNSVWTIDSEKNMKKIK